MVGAAAVGVIDGGKGIGGGLKKLGEGALGGEQEEQDRSESEH